MRAGEVLERMTTVNTGAHVLEALYQRGAGARTTPERDRAAVLLVGPHPAEGGGMDHALLADLVWHLGRAGHATLRFSFAGCGASTGTPWRPGASLTPLVRDVEAARQHLAASHPERRLYAIGVHAGARALFTADMPRVCIAPGGAARAPIAPPATAAAAGYILSPRDDTAEGGALFVHVCPALDSKLSRGLVPACRQAAQLLNIDLTPSDVVAAAGDAQRWGGASTW